MHVGSHRYSRRAACFYGPVWIQVLLRLACILNGQILGLSIVLLTSSGVSFCTCCSDIFLNVRSVDLVKIATPLSFA